MWSEAQRMLLRSCFCIWSGHSQPASGVCLGQAGESCPGDKPRSWGSPKIQCTAHLSTHHLVTTGTCHESTPREWKPEDSTDRLNDDPFLPKI